MKKIMSHILSACLSAACLTLMLGPSWSQETIPTPNPTPTPPPTPTPRPTPKPGPTFPKPGPENWLPYAAVKGGGIYGANRSVRASGYTAVTGTFENPTFDLKPTEGKVGTKWAGKKINRPTFYLGVEGLDAGGRRTITDAGLQWETDPGRDRNLLPGWTVFHRITVADKTGSWGLWIASGAEDRIPQQQLGRTVLKHEVQPNGKLMLYATSPGMGTHNFGPYTGIFPKSSGKVKASAVTVRRNVGLTQAEAEKPKSLSVGGTIIAFDGSTVENLFVKNAKVSNKSGSNLPSTAFTAWPRGIDKLLPDGKKPDAPKEAPWVIDFKAPSKPRAKTKKGEYTTGYSTENVTINLGSKHIGRGKK